MAACDAYYFHRQSAFAEYEGLKMADLNGGDQSRDCAELAQSQGSTTELDRVQELAWALIDERISNGEKAWLDEALCRSEEARRTYLHCIQLHADLAAHFAPPAPAQNQSRNRPCWGSSPKT